MMTKTANCARLIVISSIFFHQAAYCESFGEARVMTTAKQEIALSGTASGGVLTLVAPAPRSVRYVSITTSAGESAESVIGKLATVINESDPFGWWGDRSKIYWSPESGVQAVGNTLQGVPGGPDFTFAGTERGLGILKPPLSLSGSYNAEKDQVILRWINPSGEYDAIKCTGGTKPPNTTSCVVPMNGRDLDDVFFYVLGVSGKTPSSPAIITISKNAQEELGCLPFFGGVAPNWGAWSTSADPGAAKFEQGVKPDVDERRFIREPAHKPFFQFIKASAPNVQAGVWRKFLGLTPGHTYRISARLNTLEMDACKSDWSFSLHAAHNGPAGTDLSNDQLSGAAALPDGSRGSAAGRIALYGPGVTTSGKWVKCSTDVPGAGLEIKDITLSAGIDTITIWVRHTGSDSTGVGIDWLKLEDVTN